MPSAVNKQASLFLHVPKSGGTALTLHLRSILGAANVFHVEVGSPYQRVSPEVLLRRYRVVMGHFLFAQISSAMCASTFLFTFLREPTDRIVSQYHFLKSGDSDHESTNKLGEGQDFEGLLTEGVGKGQCSLWSNWQTFLFSGETVPEQPAKTLLPAALHNLERFDFVGIYERFLEGTVLLGERRGWPLTTPIPRFKVSRDRPAIREVDPTLAERILEANRCDEQLYARAQELWERTKTSAAVVSARPVSPPPTPPSETASGPTTRLRRCERGTLDITFSKVTVTDGRTGRDAVIEQGNPMEIRLGIYSQNAADDINVGVRISDEAGIEVYGISTRLLGRLLRVAPGSTLDLCFTLDLTVAPGGYHLDVAIDSGGEHLPKIHHWIDDVTIFWCVLRQPAAFAGLVDLRAMLTVDDGAANPATKPLPPQNVSVTVVA